MASERPRENPYDILGVPPGASPEEMAKAYRKLVRRYPPELAPQRFARIHAAYQHLTSPEQRMEAARRAPEETLEQLFPVPDVTLTPTPPPVPPLQEGDLEPLIGPLRRQVLVQLLRQVLRR